MISDPPAQHGRIMLGMILMAAGLLMLIERLGIADVRLTSAAVAAFSAGPGPAADHRSAATGVMAAPGAGDPACGSPSSVAGVWPMSFTSRGSTIRTRGHSSWSLRASPWSGAPPRMRESSTARKGSSDERQSNGAAHAATVRRADGDRRRRAVHARQSGHRALGLLPASLLAGGTDCDRTRQVVAVAGGDGWIVRRSPVHIRWHLAAPRAHGARAHQLCRPVAAPAGVLRPVHGLAGGRRGAASQRLT